MNTLTPAQMRYSWHCALWFSFIAAAVLIVHGPVSAQTTDTTATTDVQFNIAGSSAASATTRNQRAVGSVLDAVDGRLMIPDSEPVILPDPGGAGIPLLLEQLSGEIHASVAGITVQSTSQFVDTLSRRLRTNSRGDVGVYGGGASFGAPPFGAAAPLGVQLVSDASGGNRSQRQIGLS